MLANGSLFFSSQSVVTSNSQAQLGLFNSAYAGNWTAKMGGWLGRKPLRLLDLEEVTAGRRVVGRHYIGVRSIPIHKIRGSEGRVTDFDADFRVLNQHTRDRWMRVAEARWRGVPLPPVELVQVGDDYYVRDGHHRISVAKALGEEVIEAEVVVMVLG